MTDGRAPRADARRNRQRVLDAAESAFATEGISVPIDEIARRAEVGAGTVYRHFPTKEALFHAILTSRVERLTEEARAAAREQDPGAAFFAFLTALVQEGRAKRDLVDALASGGAAPTHPAGTAQELRSAIEVLLVRAQRAGAVRDDVRIADLMALLRGISVAVRDAAVADVGHLVGIVADGLRPVRSARPGPRGTDPDPGRPLSS